MLSSSESTLSRQEVGKLQRLRASLLAFQTKIAPLPATEYNDVDNEQFNQLRREAKILLKRAGFEQEVPAATTEESRTERVQKVLVPRLFGIMTVGVFLVLVGLGVNSIILDQLIINVMACLVSSTGMLLVIGTFVVYQLNQSSSRLSTYADLYQRGEALLGQINAALEANGVARPGAVPTVAELALDSLRNLADHWEDKLAGLKAQATAAPSPELTTGLQFVQKELARVQAELAKLEGQPPAQPAMLPSGRPEPPPSPAPVAPPPVDAEPNPEIIEQARANTMGMPLSNDMKASPPLEESNEVQAPDPSEIEPPLPPTEPPPTPIIEAEIVDPQPDEIARANTMGMPPVIIEAETEEPETPKTAAE